MRILLVHPGPDFSVADVYRGWADALRDLGHKVVLYNTSDRLIFYSKALLPSADADGNLLKDEQGLPIVQQAMSQEQAITASMQGLTHACYAFWPDVVLFVSGFFVPGPIFQMMHLRNHKLVLLHTESPYQDEEQLERAQFADLNLLNDPTNIAAYKEFGPALYMPHAYRPEVHYPRRGPVNPELAADLTFIGTGFKSRVEFFERMDFGDLDVLLGGNWDDEMIAPDSKLRKYIDPASINPNDVSHTIKKCVDNTETAELYRNAKSSVNLYRRESEDSHVGEGWAMGPREVELAACRTFFLRDPRPESDEVFPMLPTFASPEDASEQLKWWIENDVQREEAARQARLAIADRTFTNNAKRLLRALDEI